MNMYAKMEMHEKWKLFLVSNPNPKKDEPLWRIVVAEDAERGLQSRHHGRPRRMLSY